VSGSAPSGAVADAGAPDAAEATDAADAATNQDSGSGKVPVDTFPCGSQTCTAGTQACCASAATFTCAALTTGCAVPDSGPPPPPLKCTTYNACPGLDRCCYDARTGSSCQFDCANDQVDLCHLGVDGCGLNATCVSMTPAPAPNVGYCHHFEI
jgi:hypothetical protein